jgi:flagellar motor switch protein FliM
MNQILTKEEVESLLGGLETGEVKIETDAPEQAKAAELYDFNQQRAPLHLSVPALGIINERFVALLKASLSAATGVTVEVDINSMDSKKFREFSQVLRIPTYLNIFRMKPLKGSAIMVLETPLVFSFVSTLFGGTGVSEVKVEGRKFTSIETKIIGKITNIILSDLERAWSDFHRIQFSLSRAETDPKFAAVVAPNETVIVVNFKVTIENESGMLILCLPYFTIEPIKDKLKHVFQEEKTEVDQTVRKSIEARIREFDVDLSCTLGRTTMSGKELLELKVDDVITLDQRLGDSIVVQVEGVGKFKGYPGCCNNKQAVRIMEKLYKE